MKISIKLKSLLMTCFVFLFTLIVIPGVHAYYGYGYGGLSGLGGGLYGYSNLYGSGGLYGGLYGLGGLGGLYGYGGLSGLGGGLYGYSSLYGGGGLYGGLYGLGGGLRYGLAEQAGTWEGLWWLDFISPGPMTLVLVQDPLITTSLTGTVQLLNNAVIPTIVDVTGELLNNQIILTGTGLDVTGVAVDVQIVGTLSSPTEMDGNYTIIKLPKTVVENGAFQLTLTTPVL